jgi:chromosomal replication initiation ATPase DnaA
MSGRKEQLVLDLAHREAMGREDFLVTGSNAAAVELIDQWPHWPAQGAILIGPEGSGKTHLVEAWRQRSGAERLTSGSLAIENAPALLAKGALAIEDAAPGIPETALFHVMNLARQQRASLLLTSQTTHDAWKLALPDLVSRLKTLPNVRIMAPDDQLLRAVLVKQFSDRQISIDEASLNFILTRMPRSLAAARQLVAEADRRGLAEKAEITRPFLARVLTDMTEKDLFNDTG